MLQLRALNIVIIVAGVAILLIVATFVLVKSGGQSGNSNVIQNKNSSVVVEDEFGNLQNYKMGLSENIPNNKGISEFGERTVFSWCGGCKKYNTTQTGSKIQPAAIEHRLIKTEQADLSGDGVDEEYSLDDGKLIITQENNSIWQSDGKWWVDDFFLVDSTGDGIVNINFSVWKAGNYGSSQPFWEEENDMSVKNHFFVFEFKEDIVKPIWQSSNLDNPNCEFTFADVDNDGQQELIVIEGEYTDGWECQGKHVAVWQWQEWGFFNDWRSRAGTFKDLEIVEKNNEFYITAEGG
jgi:hypothetical protein